MTELFNHYEVADIECEVAQLLGQQTLVLGVAGFDDSFDCVDSIADLL